MSPGPRKYLYKWWKYYTPTNGMITRTLSPFQQDVVTPLFKHMPANAVKRVTDNVWDVGPAVVLLVGTYYWANSAYEKEMKKHRY